MSFKDTTPEYLKRLFPSIDVAPNYDATNGAWCAIAFDASSGAATILCWEDKTHSTLFRDLISGVSGSVGAIQCIAGDLLRKFKPFREQHRLNYAFVSDFCDPSRSEYVPELDAVTLALWNGGGLPGDLTVKAWQEAMKGRERIDSENIRVLGGTRHEDVLARVLAGHHSGRMDLDNLY